MTACLDWLQTDTYRERYASTEEFQQLFHSDREGLFHLAYALTADTALAQECLVCGLEDCKNANSVFREWAAKWARRVIIRTAIRLLRQAARSENATDEQESLVDSSIAHLLNDSSGLDRILRLPDLERVVYVLSVVEQYSSKEIALLVGRSLEEIREARVRAVQQMADSETAANSTDARALDRFAEAPAGFLY